MSWKSSEFCMTANERVYLSEIVSGDRDALVEHLNDRQIYDATLRIPYPYSKSDADRFLRQVAESKAHIGQPLHFGIRQLDQQLIGGCGFGDLTCGHRAEIGYWLARPYWGQGIMTDVVRAACEFASTQWRLVRITAYVFESNHASARVLEKNGFVLEGVLRKCHQKEGRFLDSRLYALVL